LPPNKWDKFWCSKKPNSLISSLDKGNVNFPLYKTVTILINI